MSQSRVTRTKNNPGTALRRAWVRALGIQERAAKRGFDWPEVQPVLAKISEEVEELRVELRKGDRKKVEAELGDLIFSLANLTRLLRLDAGRALNLCSDKFTRRWDYIEKALLKSSRRFEDCTLRELDALWDEAKRLEKC